MSECRATHAGAPSTFNRPTPSTPYTIDTQKFLPEQWLKSRPDSGLDCLICAKLARQRSTFWIRTSEGGYITHKV